MPGGTIDATLRNKGVALRAQNDAERAEEEAALSTWQHAQKKLEEKSRLYDQFVRGGMQDVDERHGDYLIDFEAKEWQSYEEGRRYEGIMIELIFSLPPPPSSRHEETQFYHEDVQREEQRLRWEEEARRLKEEEVREYEKRREDRIALNEVIQETRAGRERAQMLQEEKKRRLELRKMQVQKRAEQQKARLEAQKQAEAAAAAAAKETKEAKKLHIKSRATDYF